MEYLESAIHDPRWNLALEEYVFDCMDRSKSYLILWQNDHTIVIGKYQNAIAEINNDYVRDHGITLVRRLSGGGTVYHDLGNLNYTFIMDADEAETINFHMFCQPIIETLADFGVKAELTGRNDLVVDGKKFSGSAQYIRQGRVMHHGCIMLSADLTVLGRALHVDQEKIASKGVKSVVSRVTNLCDYLPSGIGVEEFKAALISHLSKKEDFHPCQLSEAVLEEIARRKQARYDTWQWNYGRSPAYSNTRRQRIEGCGTVEVSLKAEHGKLEDWELFGDFFAQRDLAELIDALRGCELRRESVAARLAQYPPEEYIRGLNAQALSALLVP